MNKMTKDQILNSKAVISCDYGSIEIPIKDVMLPEFIDELEDSDDVLLDVEDFIYDWFTSTLNINIE